MVRDINAVPWSVRISFGIPTREIILNRASATLFAEMLRSATASGYRLHNPLEPMQTDALVLTVQWPDEVHTNSFEGDLH